MEKKEATDVDVRLTTTASEGLSKDVVEIDMRIPDDPTAQAKFRELLMNHAKGMKLDLIWGPVVEETYNGNS